MRGGNYITILFFCVLGCVDGAKHAPSPELEQILLDDWSQLVNKGLECIPEHRHIRYMAMFRLFRMDDLALVCHLRFLMDVGEDSFTWSSLGHIYKHQNRHKDADLCFQQSGFVGPYITSNIQLWHFVGPFSVGKSEVDGDPLEAYGGVFHSSKHRFQMKPDKFISELSPQISDIAWNALQYTDEPGAEDGVTIKPKLDWNILIKSLISVAIMEWQGWAVGEVQANLPDANYLLQCLGANTVFINKIPVVSDQYLRSNYWFSFPFETGISTVIIKLRTVVEAHFNCRFIQALKAFKVYQPEFLPDIYEGYLFSQYITFAVANNKRNEWITDLQIRFRDTSETRFSIKRLDSNAMDQIAPGQTKLIKLLLIPNSEPVAFTCSEIDLDLIVSSGKHEEELRLKLRCRQGDQSFVFTFLDHDGSIQHGAAIRPIKKCPAKICPILLTLHGTGSSAQNMADSYKRWRKNAFLFGLERVWIVAPTRHGAHNWEGPGALTALSALDSFSDLVAQKTWLENKASKLDVIFAGHSMGGHGALHLVTHFPDLAIGAVVLSSWNRKEDYGDNNVLFRHDVAASDTDPSQKAILEACVSENDCDRFISNLKGVPVLLRAGANDSTVHPYHLKRIHRLMEREGVNVTYIEIENKEHWWWDTWKTNDGGAVNDPQIRRFTNGLAVKKVAVESCSDSRHDCDKMADSENFTVTVFNPAFHGSVRGFRVLRQKIPHRTSRLKVTVSAEMVSIETINVAMFGVEDCRLRPLSWGQKSVQIDGKSEWTWDIIEIMRKSPTMCFCKNQRIWTICNDCNAATKYLRSAVTMGPARRIAEEPFVIVTGTDGKAERNLLHFAVYIANQFFLTSDTFVSIVKDTDFTLQELEPYNVLVIGNSSQNLFTKELLSRTPLKTDNGAVKLGHCDFAAPRTGVMTLTPHGKGRLAMVLSANDYDAYLDLISLARPTITPMARSPFSNLLPDFVITGPEFGLKGPAGYLCSGFWGHFWDLRPELVSCAHCLV